MLPEERKEVTHSRTQSGEREFGISIFVKQKNSKRRERQSKKQNCFLTGKEVIYRSLK